MTAAQVEDVLIEFLQDALETDYPTLIASNSAEVINNWAEQKKTEFVGAL
jgi:hypothetical protein